MKAESQIFLKNYSNYFQIIYKTIQFASTKNVDRKNNQMKWRKWRQSSQSYNIISTLIQKKFQDTPEQLNIDTNNFTFLQNQYNEQENYASNKFVKAPATLSSTSSNNYLLISIMKSIIKRCVIRVSQNTIAINNDYQNNNFHFD